MKRNKARLALLTLTMMIISAAAFAAEGLAPVENRSTKMEARHKALQDTSKTPEARLELVIKELIRTQKQVAKLRKFLRYQTMNQSAEAYTCVIEDLFIGNGPTEVIARVAAVNDCVKNNTNFLRLRDCRGLVTCHDNMLDQMNAAAKRATHAEQSQDEQVQDRSDSEPSAESAD